MKTDEEDGYNVTYEAAAERLGLSIPSIKNLVAAGKLQAFRVGRRSYISPASIDAELERRAELRAMGAMPRTSLAGRTGPPRGATEKEAPRVPHLPGYTGEVAAAAVELFEKGLGVRDVVKALKITFELAEHMRNRYFRAGPEIVISVDEQKQLKAKLGIRLDHSPTGQVLLQAIDKLIKEYDETNATLSGQIHESTGREPILKLGNDGKIRAQIFNVTDDGVPNIPDTRSVDVTEVLKMTKEELATAGWLRHKPPAPTGDPKGS